MQASSSSKGLLMCGSIPAMQVKVDPHAKNQAERSNGSASRAQTNNNTGIGRRYQIYHLSALLKPNNDVQTLSSAFDLDLPQPLILFIGGNGQCTQLYNPLMNCKKVPQHSYAESQWQIQCVTFKFDFHMHSFDFNQSNYICLK